MLFIGAVAGLLTLLSALTMGLLIWTAYGVYAGQNIAIQTLAAKFLQLDLALANYGPDAKDLRLQLHEGLSKTIDAVWGANESDANFGANNFAEAIRNMRTRNVALETLHPSTDAQAQALAVAKATSEAIGQFACVNQPFYVPIRQTDNGNLVTHVTGNVRHTVIGAHQDFLRRTGDIDRAGHLQCDKIHHSYFVGLWYRYQQPMAVQGRSRSIARSWQGDPTLYLVRLGINHRQLRVGLIRCESHTVVNRKGDTLSFS